MVWWYDGYTENNDDRDSNWRKQWMVADDLQEPGWSVERLTDIMIFWGGSKSSHDMMRFSISNVKNLPAVIKGHYDNDEHRFIEDDCPPNDCDESWR